jgi:hypothetical protein
MYRAGEYADDGGADAAAATTAAAGVQEEAEEGPGAEGLDPQDAAARIIRPDGLQPAGITVKQWPQGFVKPKLNNLKAEVTRRDKDKKPGNWTAEKCLKYLKETAFPGELARERPTHDECMHAV